MRDDPVGMASLVLVIVGALNWGLVGVGGFLGSNLNLVNLLLGPGILGTSVVENLVYLLVGLAGLYEVYEAAEM
ncbi:MAG: DUF378 domain-containing protein [Candidatus Nanohaloarchaea archaeon]|nr:DUF378 domain-containing protein [Candidatus Nanohaloarchaea archaeon]